MRKVFILLLCLVLVSSVCYADGLDISSMTVKERNELIDQLTAANYKEQHSIGKIKDFDECTRKNPLLLGETVVFTYTQLKNDFNVSMKISEIFSGENALQYVMDANGYNDYPEEGKEYIVAKFDVSVLCENDSAKFSFDDYIDFDCVSSKGNVYEKHSIAGIKGDVDMYSGGSDELYVAAMVDENDQFPLLLYKDTIWISVSDALN